MKAKFTTLQLPKELKILELARQFADQLEAESAIQGAKVPMYIAVKVALEEALAERSIRNA